MAQPRVYRDGIQCPRCGSNWLPKYGRSRGKQTYRCGQCLYHFIPGAEHPHQPEQVKNLAVAMYNEGASTKAIGRVLGMKTETIHSWVKRSAPNGAVAATPSPDPVGTSPKSGRADCDRPRHRR